MDLRNCSEWYHPFLTQQDRPGAWSLRTADGAIEEPIEARLRHIEARIRRAEAAEGQPAPTHQEDRMTPYEILTTATALPEADALELKTAAETSDPEAPEAARISRNNPYAPAIAELRAATAVAEPERTYRLARLTALAAEFDAPSPEAPRALGAADDPTDNYMPPNPYAAITADVVVTARVTPERADKAFRAARATAIAELESEYASPDPYASDIERLTRKEAKRKADVMAGRRWR